MLLCIATVRVFLDHCWQGDHNNHMWATNYTALYQKLGANIFKWFRGFFRYRFLSPSISFIECLLLVMDSLSIKGSWACQTLTMLCLFHTEQNTKYPAFEADSPFVVTGLMIGMKNGWCWELPPYKGTTVQTHVGTMHRGLTSNSDSTIYTPPPINVWSPRNVKSLIWSKPILQIV